MSFIQDPQFLQSFNYGMKYEVGPWWDPTDPEVISGACETLKQKRKVGYCNIAGDSGGLTKYGIAQNYNKTVDVQNLDLEKTKQIYADSYWVLSSCHLITIPIHIFYFDMVINNGIGRAGKILQEALGLTGTNVDGIVGRNTINSVNSSDAKTLIEKMAGIRTQRYKTIVANNPTQQKFLTGWLNRTEEVKKVALASI